MDGGIAEEQGRRGEESLDFEKETIVGAGRGQDIHSLVVGQIESFSQPFTRRAQGVDVSAALDMFERSEHEVVPGGLHLLREFDGGGGEDRGGL